MATLAVGLGALVLLAVVFSGRPPRFRFWRGTPEGTRDEVQAEHLALFFPPETDDPEDDA